MRSMTLAIGLLLGLSCNTFGQAAHDPDRVDARSDSQRMDDRFGQAHYDPGLFNVRNYGATGNGQTDDSAAIALAAAAAVASSTRGLPSVLYFPSGAYRLVTSLPMWTVPVSVLGDGHERSVVLVDSAFSGDVFSWSEVWMAGNYKTDTISPLATQKAGVEVIGIRIAGNRTTTNVQNAFVFYDRADLVFMQDVDVFDLTGRALYSGVLRRTSLSYMRESHFKGLRFIRCGSIGTPVIDFNTQGGGDSTNEVSIDALNIVAPFGTGLVIRNNNPAGGVRTIKFAGLRIEGNGTVPADLVQVGDASLSGNVNNIDFEQTELLNPPPGFAAIRFAAPNPRLAPYQVRLQGKIGGEAANGKGIAIDAGRDLFFDLEALHTKDVNVAVASSKTVAGPIVFDGHGQESRWTRSIDPSSIANVKRPIPHALQQF